MRSIAIIGTTLVCTGAGGLLGLWYGFATDKSDFPIKAAFTGPMGALIGGGIGVCIGAVVFA